MERNDAIQLQNEIRCRSEDLRSNLKGMYDWQKDIKEKEKQLKKEKQENEKLPPIRSHVEEFEKFDKDKQNNIVQDTQKSSSSPNTALNSKKEADSYKEQGNQCVKLQQYEKALNLYTTAISLFNTESIYYCNRALCHLKLDRLELCLEDCSAAIKIDDQSYKAYYRRMQAYEALGSIDKALSDCKTVLEIVPKDPATMKDYERLKKKLHEIQAAEKRKAFKALFAELSLNNKEIDFVKKPPHLRSKKPLQQIEIEEVLMNERKRSTKSIEDANESKHQKISPETAAEDELIDTDPIPDSVIDKLFNNNTGESTEEIRPRKTYSSTPTIPAFSKNFLQPLSTNETKAEKQKTNISKAASEEKLKTAPVININDEEKENKYVPTLPLSGSQFYTTWKELPNYARYLYLDKLSQETAFAKILGASFESEILAEILKILNDYFIPNNNIQCLKLLKEIGMNSEIGILSLFLSEQDKTHLNNLLKFLENNNKADSDADFKFIKTKFNL